MSVLKQISVDWARAAKLSNPAVLNAFRKRASDARIQNSQLLSAKTDIDFAHYRSILKNGAIVEEAEKLLNSFKAVDYDVSAQLKAIGAFESKAVESAKASAVAIEAELGDLNSTLKNIQDARPFNELTLDDVSKARPEITKAVESMISKGKWTVPGYVEKFGNLSAF